MQKNYAQLPHQGPPGDVTNQENSSYFCIVLLTRHWNISLMRVSQKKYRVFPIQFATVSHTFVGKILQKYARISRTFLSDILWGQIFYAYLSSLNWPFHRALKWTCPAGHLKHPIKSKSGLKNLKIYYVTLKYIQIPLLCSNIYFLDPGSTTLD